MQRMENQKLCPSVHVRDDESKYRITAFESCKMWLTMRSAGATRWWLVSRSHQIQRTSGAWKPLCLACWVGQGSAGKPPRRTRFNTNASSNAQSTGKAACCAKGCRSNAKARHWRRQHEKDTARKGLTLNPDF